MKSNTYIIGIAGASGSGKTTFAQNLAKKFTKEEVLLITQDAYYKDLMQLTISDRAKHNFDHPDSLDFKLLKEHLYELKLGISIQQPIYDFNSHSRLSSTRTIEPKRIIIVEGTLILSQKELLKEYNTTVYIQLDQQTCLDRRIKRDISERGRTKEEVLLQYRTTVLPMYEEFIKPSLLEADTIIPGVENSTDLEKTHLQILAEIKNRSHNS
jgi:uridine kinase